MDLQGYERTIVATTRDDWTIIPCWGFGSGPSFLDRVSDTIIEQGRFVQLEIESHAMRASLKADLAIWFAWGFPSNPDFREPWANKFLDPTASSWFVDFFFGSALVYRDVYVSVDGGRCMLPLPDLQRDGSAHEPRYTVARNRYTFFRLLDSFERPGDFDRYFREAGFEVVDAPWMA